MIELKINMYATYENLDLVATFNLGYEHMVQSFFSTIAYNLENKKWGSVYPAIMKEFYKGKLEPNRIDYAIAEIKDIKNKLSQLNVSKMIYDFEKLDQLPLIDPKLDIKIDDVYKNDNGERMTDIILKVLTTLRDKKIPLYIGEYYYQEISKPENINIIKKTQSKIKRNKIIKYIIYLLIILILKYTAPASDFNRFIKIFLFSIAVAELFNYHRKSIIKSKEKESLEKRLSRALTPSPKIRIEKITFKRDLRSSTFDYTLDKIKCPQTFDGIKEKLKLKKIRKWQADLKKIHEELGYDINFAEEMIDDFKKYEPFEYYEFDLNPEVISKELMGNIYNENNIHRILKTKNEIYLLIFKNKMRT